MNCRGWIGGEPESDEEIYEDEEEEESDEESVVADGSDVAEGKADASIVKELKKTKAAAKPKKPKDATKKPVRKERTKVARKITTKRMKRVEIMDDPDLDKEIDELTLSGLKNQPHTLKLSRLMGKSFITNFCLWEINGLTPDKFDFIFSESQIAKGKESSDGFVARR